MSPQTFLDALKRYLNLVLRVDSEWNLVVAEKPTMGEAIFPFSVIGLLASLLFAVLGIALRIGERSFLLELTAHLLTDVGGVAAFTLVSAFLTTRVDAVRPQLGGVAALYSCTGFWLSSVLLFVPIPALGWLRLLMGAVYTGYLYNRSLDLVLGIPGHARLRALGLPMLALVLGAAVVRLVFTLLLVRSGVW